MNASHMMIAAIAAAVAVPASAATTVTYGPNNPNGVVTLAPAGTGAVASPISFDVSGDGDFEVIFSFTNPFASARGNGSASFNFDPDVLVFTGGNFSNGGTFAIGGVSGVGSSIQVDTSDLLQGLQTLTLRGTLNPGGAVAGGNDFARVGGSLTLTSAGVVPEPATWALFILGFGAIGGALRRRAGKVRVSKATLTFA